MLRKFITGIAVALGINTAQAEVPSQSNSSCYYIGMKSLVDNALANAPLQRKSMLYGTYYREDQLKDYATWLDHYATLNGVDGWAAIMFMWEQSRFQYDAVSMYNTTKPAKFGQPGWQEYNWQHPKIGLDWGIAQFHCPGNMWCSRWDPSEIPKFKNPELSIGFLTLWFKARIRHTCVADLSTKAKCLNYTQWLSKRSSFGPRMIALRKSALATGCKGPVERELPRTLLQWQTLAFQ